MGLTKCACEREAPTGRQPASRLAAAASQRQRVGGHQVPRARAPDNYAAHSH